MAREIGVAAARPQTIGWPHSGRFAYPDFVAAHTAPMPPRVTSHKSDMICPSGFRGVRGADGVGAGAAFAAAVSAGSHSP
jgi:hypothetical protein